MRTLALVFFGTLFITALDAAKPSFAGDDALLETGIGAALGGLAGGQFGHGAGQLVATGAGIAAGGAIGNEIGNEVDLESSRPYREGPVATNDNAPLVYYSYTPNYVPPAEPAPPPAPGQPETYQGQDGTYCRPYSQEIRVDGQAQESYGTACLQPDGTWRIVQ
jgi:surface antigen